MVRESSLKRRGEKERERKREMEVSRAPKRACMERLAALMQDDSTGECKSLISFYLGRHAEPFQVVPSLRDSQKGAGHGGRGQIWAKSDPVGEGTHHARITSSACRPRSAVWMLVLLLGRGPRRACRTARLLGTGRSIDVAVDRASRMEGRREKQQLRLPPTACRLC